MKLLSLLTTLLILVFAPARAAEDEGIMNHLFAPGPLIKGHAELEGTQCLKCHESGKGVPDSKCLDCHKEIRPFVEKKSGFHGLAKGTCFSCHSDHKGRDFDSVKVDPKTFDHKTTGFSLDGKHSDLKCAECHKEKRGEKKIRPNDVHYLGNAKTCVACHKKDDIHFFKDAWSKKDCSACHGVESWKEEIKFDHLKDTKYELVGKHAEKKCQECHNPKSWEGRPTAKGFAVYKWPKLSQDKCLSCHDNFHKDRMQTKFLGGDCLKCHDQTQKTWKVASFDHKVTGYALRGKHDEIKCQDCHKQTTQLFSLFSGKRLASPNWKGLKTDCLSCHKDFHLFGPLKSTLNMNVNQCQNCHDEVKWKNIHDFNHNAHTRFKIDGEHRESKCEDCHLPQKAKWQSKFMLPIPPAEKNAKFGKYHWPMLKEKTCENCHTNVHIGKFSAELLRKACTECHVTDGWKVVGRGKKFDHNKTRFPLTGKHVKATCTQCHVKNKQEIYVFKSTDKGFCIECHDNVHKNQFSQKFSAQSCGECHTSDNFTKRLPFDHKTTRYPLNGSHAPLDCAKCHTPTHDVFPVKPPKWKSKFLFPNLDQDKCLSCHADAHKGQLSNDCLSCHNETKWKKFRFDHEKQSRYPLRGKHAEIRCSECHKPRPNETVMEYGKALRVVHFKPIGMACINCHKDPHKGHFGPSCISCHNEKTWKSTQDFHKNFNLSGVHLVAQCSECHSQGRKLAGMSSECLICHKKDDVHSGTLARCGECHRQQFWENPNFNHSLTSFPLRGAHRTISCQSCHSRGAYQGLSSDCVSCHLQQGIQAARPEHSAPNFTSCSDCHRHQFSFQIR